ncbi:MAG: hypothetical protein PWQ58_940 [Archaeoglobaceae archaeon]|nr:hypothetical protein [Archaeoglobaceae archaeon]
MISFSNKTHNATGFKDYSRYFGILSVIAAGAVNFSEVASKGGLPRTSFRNADDT